VSLPARFPQTPILCYVTDRKNLQFSSLGDSRGQLLKRIAGATSAGIDWIQVREKDLPGKEIASVVRDSLAAVREANRQSGKGTRILVNDRLDVALSEHAGGVHLGENSLPAGDVRRWIGEQLEQAASPDFRVGVSCHSLESALVAWRDGADYIFFGPIFATPAKTAFGAPQGLAKLEEICKSVSVPVLAIGGITVENAASCVEAGAAGIAAIRLFQDTADLPALVRQLRGVHG
jgi:thiamine-phosphate pyrophosphorylase